MNFINSWKAINKQKDKLTILCRISTLTIFELSVDFSSKTYRLVLLNFGIEL